MNSIASVDSPSTVSRRGALGLGAAVSALLLGARSASASIRTGGGIAGGGWATWETGEAQLSVFGSRFVDDEIKEPIVFGSLRWADASGFTLTSESIVSYGPVEPTETTRELVGLVRNIDGDTRHGFTLTMTDGGGPGEELDALKLVVGPALADEATPGADVVRGGPATLEIDARLQVGDLQLLTFGFPE